MARAKHVRRRSATAFAVDAGHLRQALAGMSYPAQRWQILSWAEYNGAGGYVVTELHRIPAGSYDGLEQVIDAYEKIGTPAAWLAVPNITLR